MYLKRFPSDFIQTRPGNYFSEIAHGARKRRENARFTLHLDIQTLFSIQEECLKNEEKQGKIFPRDLQQLKWYP